MSAPLKPQPIASVGQLLLVWLVMLAVLAIIGVSDVLPLGAYLPWVQFGGAALILALLAFLWMNLGTAPVAVRIAAFVAVFFLFILVFLSFNDFLTRRMDVAPFQAPSAVAAPM